VLLVVTAYFRQINYDDDDDDNDELSLYIRQITIFVHALGFWMRVSVVIQFCPGADSGMGGPGAPH